MHNPLSIKGKVILVTGAASGIGRQCAIDFANAGADLILLDLNAEALKSVREECEATGRRCFIKGCDLTASSALPNIIDEAVSQIGPVNGLLHAAGIEKTLPFNKFTPADYEKIFAVNVVGAMTLVSILTKKKYRAASARYVLIASITAMVGRPGVNAYAASKGALVSSVKTLALELAPKGITINCISPGTILTPLMENMLKALSEEQRAERVAGFPLGLGRPSDISSTAIFLMSEGARWITGQNIVVDGGYTSR
ncbi:MAG: SDR family oxidoreductase [Bacteroides sp.]|nr:SDR family oxidoreductase [Bacteroides sp.]